MKVCKVKGCSRKHYGKGFCRRHYIKILYGWYIKGLNDGTYKKRGICKFDGCDRGIYAKSYCRLHYARIERTGSVERHSCYAKGKICMFTGCDRPVSGKGYCSLHYRRFSQHGDPSIKLSNKGTRNGMWKGGISYYPNHTLMKKNRATKVRQHNNKCEVCGKKAKSVHHKDGSKTNHELSNLLLVCNKCHWRFHTGRKCKTSKFKRLYGMTLREMSKKFGVNVGNLYYLHQQGKLSQYAISLDNDSPM